MATIVLFPVCLVAQTLARSQGIFPICVLSDYLFLKVDDVSEMTNLDNEFARPQRYGWQHCFQMLRFWTMYKLALRDIHQSTYETKDPPIDRRTFDETITVLAASLLNRKIETRIWPLFAVQEDKKEDDHDDPQKKKKRGKKISMISAQ